MNDKRISSEWADDVLYPAIFSMIDQVMPEMEFQKKGYKWISKFKLFGGKPKKARNDKTVITQNRPGSILEHGSNAVSIGKYIADRDNIKYGEALRKLATLANLDIVHKDGSVSSVHGISSNPHRMPKGVQIIAQGKKQVKPAYIPLKLLKSMQSRDISQNSLFSFLVQTFPESVIREVFEFYGVGTITDGSAAFPFIDDMGNIRGIQTVRFDDKGSGGNRRSSISSHLKRNRSDKKLKQMGRAGWIDDYLKYTGIAGQFNCLFGANKAVMYPGKPVAVVESPKTAIICEIANRLSGINKAVYVSCYTLGGLTQKRMQVLKDRHVSLLPDLNAIDEWGKSAEKLKRLFPTMSVKIDEWWCEHPEDVGTGKDIADYLIEYYQRYEAEETPGVPSMIKMIANKTPDPEKFISFADNFGLEVDSIETLNEDDEPEPDEQPDEWTERIEKVKSRLNGIDCPDVLEAKYSTIAGLKTFIKSHMMTVEANKNKNAYLPFLERLEAVAEYLSRRNRSQKFPA